MLHSHGEDQNSACAEGTNGLLTSGSANNLRWEVTNMNNAKGTFTLLIRRGDDTNRRKTILEQYNNLTLDPTTPNYIARAIETADPLAKKFNKDIVLDNTFIEIPSKNIALNQKQNWLKKILNTKKDSLPKYIKIWSEEIFNKLITIENDSVIFTHFMVMNSIVSSLIKSETLLSFYPDYTSVLEIISDNKIIKSYSIEGNKKTYINL